MMDDILRRNNIKVTSQRKIILNYLLIKKQATIKEIIDNNHSIDQSTIYRILELFEKKLIVAKISIHHEIYYIVNNDQHKHYIECIKCHDLAEIDVCPYNLVDLKGFKIKSDENIKGICKKCQVEEENVGIFVGSFNPITNAHLEIGHKLYDLKIVDKVVYVPCNNSKKNDLINIFTRYKMILKAISKYKYMFVDDIEIINGKSNFSYNEMDLLKEKYSGNIYIILGTDNLLNLDKWEKYSYLLENYHFIVINRDGMDAIDIIKKKYNDYYDKFIIINYNNDLCSTIVRNKLSKNEDVSNLIDFDVFEYIKENKLYRN